MSISEKHRIQSLIAEMLTEAKYADFSGRTPLEAEKSNTKIDKYYNAIMDVLYPTKTVGVNITVHLTLKVDSEMNRDDMEKLVDKVVQELDYDFNDTTGKAEVSHMEIVGINRFLD
jgi:hypothetical protein